MQIYQWNSFTQCSSLTLVFEACANALNNGIPDIRRLMDDMKVFTSSLADNAGVTFVDVEIVREVLPQLFENKGASSEVQSGEIRVRDGLSDDFRCRSGNELDHPRRYAGFCKDLIDEVVRICCRR